MNDFSPPVPGPEHQALEPFAGDFIAEVKAWMGPGEPMLSTGSMRNEWNLNGLFLRQTYTGDAVDGPFPGFAGRGWWGYNTVDKRYEGFWIDTASSGFQLEYGQLNDGGKTWTMHGQMTNPQDGSILEKTTLITLHGPDHHSMEIFFKSADGNEFKAMEIHYQRKVS